MTADRPVEERPARLGRRAFLGSAALGAAALATAGAGPTPGPATGSRAAGCRSWLGQRLLA